MHPAHVVAVLVATTRRHIPWVVVVITSVISAGASFWVSMQYRQTRRRNPWGVHPVLWLIIGLLLNWLGFVLCLVARFTSKQTPVGIPDAPYPSVGYGNPYQQAPSGAPSPYGSAAPGPYGATPGGYPAQPGAPSGTQPTPTYGAQPTPTYGAQPTPSTGYPVAATPGPGTYSGAPGVPLGNPPAEWYADPSGKHQHRYWNGTTWTEHVADNGVASTDPVPPEAQGTPGSTPVTPG